MSRGSYLFIRWWFGDTIISFLSGAKIVNNSFSQKKQRGILGILEKTTAILWRKCYFCGRKTIDIIMLNPTNTQGIYINVPMTDWVLLKELIRKFGWQAETREQLLERFVKSRPKSPALTEEEIMEEVNAVRYGK